MASKGGPRTDGMGDQDAQAALQPSSRQIAKRPGRVGKTGKRGAVRKREVGGSAALSWSAWVPPKSCAWPHWRALTFAADPDPVEKWGRLEASVVNTTPYADPYRDVSLDVTYRSPSAVGCSSGESTTARTSGSCASCRTRSGGGTTRRVSRRGLGRPPAPLNALTPTYRACCPCSKRLFGNEFAQKVAHCKRVREQPLAGSIVPDAGRHCEATATLALWRARRATETAVHHPTLRPDCTVSDTHRHREPLLMANALVGRNEGSLVLLGECQSPLRPLIPSICGLCGRGRGPFRAPPRANGRRCGRQ